MSAIVFVTCNLMYFYKVRSIYFPSVLTMLIWRCH